ncbi:MAG TPA: 2-amino-4-hydroxy-6-hydroxymethyldihydropteridine diphosphokinase [Bacteroidales bacterium]|nr:2-amino-4-hydroxy-6-hydroxymethyldihydropteridine diphosphokinase [Bacteroidales bacterium]
MHKIVLLTGSNQGERLGLIRQAKQLLENELGLCVKASSIYESAPWGFESETKFLNQVLLFFSDFGHQEILRIGLKIETDLGRKREQMGYRSRAMDIDILFYDDKIVNEPDLQIPHPQLHKRRFTLEPLCEIMPDFIHPILKKNLHELLSECSDNLSVVKLGNENDL